MFRQSKGDFDERDGGDSKTGNGECIPRLIRTCIKDRR